MSDYKKDPDVILEGAKTRYQTNFSGRPTPFNPNGGRRTFNIELPEELALQLSDDGWNIKKYEYSTDNGGADIVYYTELVVNYAGYQPPKIWRVTSKSKILLDEDSIDILDSDTIDYVDVVINPYHWNNVNGSGIKGYVRTMHVRIVDDPFEEKYADIPERDSAEPRWFAEDED